MFSSSPLAALYQIIQQVRITANTNQGIFQKNEAATRAALIDPILRALGWDTGNVQMVEPERTVENKQSLDYVLKDAKGEIWSVIEAKKLGESLDKLGHVGAVIGYAFSLKPKSFLITDGLNWHCYSPTHSNFHPIETIDFNQDNLIEGAMKLIKWLDAAQSGHWLRPVNSNPSAILETKSAAEAKPVVNPIITKPSQNVKQAQKQPATEEFIDLAQLQLQSLPIGQKPKQLRLPDGTVKPIKTWKDILLEVCYFALASNPNITVPLRDKAGKKTFILTADKPLKGSSTLTSYKNKPVFIYTNYSADACIANALYATQQIPSNQKSTTVAVSF